MKNWGYYNRGRNLALVVQDTTTKEYISPNESIEDGLMLEYTKAPTDPIDEESVLDLADQLAMAIVEFVKGKMAEESGDFEKRLFYMNEFKRIVSRYQNNKVAGPRILSTGSFAIR